MASSHNITIEELFSDYKPRFIRYANSYVHDIDMSEDIVIDAIVYYWEHRNELEHDTNIAAYVLTTVKHKCLNYLQHQRLRQNISDKIISDAQWDLASRIATLSACEPYQLFTEEMEVLVDEALNKLPERTKNIFIMSRYENMSYKEIAEKFDITTKGVEFHISKALSLLRISLKDYSLVLLPFLL